MVKGRPFWALRVLLIAGALVVVSIGGYSGVLVATGNVHSVVDGVLYRSAQLSKPQFDNVIRGYGIRSILNLRGGHPADAWYADEIAAAEERGVAHFDLPISARRRPSLDQVAEILRLIRDAPKPLLIHCRSGADRSGLVAALFLFDVEHAGAATADRQLSLRFGHFPYLFSKTGAMDESFWDFVHDESASGR